MRVRSTYVLTATLSVTSLRAQSPIPVTLGDGICKTISNTYECASAIETRQLSLSTGRAQRGQGGLQLRLMGGGERTVPDDTTAEWPSWFKYLGYLSSLGYYVLWEQHPEGNSIRLISARNGWAVRVDDMPVVSPDRRLFATTSLALEAAYNPNRLTIWHVRGDTLAKEWSVEPDAWGPNRAVWLSSTSLRFTRMVQASDGSLRPLAVDTARLE